MNIFKENYLRYREKGISVIPDKYKSKQPAIKAWSTYSYQLPTEEESNSWCNSFSESNIALCLGEMSGIIALDLDTVDQKILDLILPLLPSSPVEKKGAKGFTRFFKYTGENTQMLKYNGEVVLEILSSNKKTTLPPSVHPNGFQYTWTSNKELSEVNKEDLPILPPMLISHLESKLRLHIPEVEVGKGKVFSGRNDELSSLCGKLIQEGKSVDECIKELVRKDREINDTPLFSDVEEMCHSEPFTNALQFYANHLSSVNSKRFRKQEEYETPMTASAVNHEYKEMIELGKSQSQARLKKPSLELPTASGVIKTVQQNILENSFIKQPAFAFSASLVLLSTLISRKFVFQGMSPNLYVLNIAPSGSGKDAPQQKLKEYLVDIKADYLLGAGDYVSDASLMDGLETKPVRLDIMDEMGGVLRSINSGKSEYNGKMADVLAELYTSSNNIYMGRAVAEGVKGKCYRPNVNILGSTTPTGFAEGISRTAIEKGLMGRFLIFEGDYDKPAERVKNFTHLDNLTLSRLQFLSTYQPEVDEGSKINGISQAVEEILATKEADDKLDKYFSEFDNLRTSSEKGNPMLPIIARLYQQMVKITLIHAASRTENDSPLVDVIDVVFGYKTIMYYYENMKEILKDYIHSSQVEQNRGKVLNLIRTNGEVSKRKLVRALEGMNKRQREDFIQDLIEGEYIIMDVKNINGRNMTIYRSID